MSTEATPAFPSASAIVALFVAATLAMEPAADAQLPQYSEPGDLAEREISSREELRESMEAAPWKGGRWRLQPRLSFGDLIYGNNVFDDADESEQISDLRASVAAGIDAYAPIGDDLVFATFVAPSYNWWKDNAELRRLNWNYGAAVFGLFNRLSTELSVRRTESESPLNNELRIPVVTRQDRLQFDAEVRVRGPWVIFGAFTRTESRYPNADVLLERAPGLNLLARDEDVASGGLAFDVENRFRVGIGWREIDADFIDDPELRSNTGGYPFISFSATGNRVQFDGIAGTRELEFDTGSQLSTDEEISGRARVSFAIGNRTNLTLFNARNVVYSALDAGGYFASERAGVALGWGESDSLRATLFAEVGNDDYTSAGGQNAGRMDDGESYGVGFEMPLRWGLVLHLDISETTIDSNLDQFDRNLTSIGSSIRLNLPDVPF